MGLGDGVLDCSTRAKEKKGKERARTWLESFGVVALSDGSFLAVALGQRSSSIPQTYFI